ncbi:protein of unknown function [Methylococcus capsulatus]|uniref:Uncharacterized protein n=1 Tax=Methylococcus capsulatus TaxID=414 RepID=A0AA35V660_METCP|nr:protein of unknown function [Methylococcus capsulatus]
MARLGGDRRSKGADTAFLPNGRTFLTLYLGVVSFLALQWAECYS